MLHHAKVMQALVHLQDELFIDLSDNIDAARKAWQQLAADPLFQQKAQAVNSPWLLPCWEGPVDKVFDVPAMQQAYQVIAVDGSQVYPDRHQGTSCYLVNIGSVHVRYGSSCGAALTAKPYVFSGRQEHEVQENPIDIVNAKRQELELQTGLELCKQTFQDRTFPQAFLFDGSLIFWHLASGGSLLKEYYLSRYLGLMHQLYQERILHGGYISLPKSKELVNLIRIQLCNFAIDGCQEQKLVDHIVDATVASFFLQPYQRTTVFKSNSPICQEYPDHLKPYFFYLHVGNEIGRVEVPCWIAQDAALVDRIAHIMRDQSDKGQGYPVALAESHEQAVVKGPDRDFFYQMINKMAIEHRRTIAISQKSARKRRIGV